MKYLYFALLIFFARGLRAQGCLLYASDGEQIRTEKMAYGGSYFNEIDENIVWALEKYWPFGSGIGRLNKEDETVKNDKKLSLIVVNDYRHYGDDGTFFNTKLVVTNNQELIINEPREHIIFDIPFDNMIKKNKMDKVIGTDKNGHLMANKALVYTMLFCSMVKNNNKCSSLVEKHRGSTVLIPIEILDNGISKEAFTGLKYKYEFDTSDNIAKRIKEGKNTKGYSELVLIKVDTWMDYLLIIDLEKGDYVNGSSLGASVFSKTYKYMNDKRVASLIDKLN